LAFDASCGTCKDIAHAVGQACQGKLEVLALADEEVRRLRERALGVDAAWTPTLLRVDGDRVRAWTGAAMSVRLSRRLGPSDTARVIHALGALRRRSQGYASELPGAPSGKVAMSRAKFLRFGAGTGVAAGLVLFGKVPAFADDENRSAVDWAAKNSKNLPHTYNSVIRYPLRYRRAIFNASNVNVRRNLWIDHVNTYQNAHPTLSTRQRGVIDRTRAMLADRSTFTTEPTSQVQNQLDELHKDAVAAFGKSEAYALLGALGPAAAPSARPSSVSPDVPTCPCFSAANGTQDFCDSGKCTVDERCEWQQSGCGIFWINPCNGDCV
jgi:hypothetical protein